MENYPSNSRQAKAELKDKEPKKIEKVVTGSVIRRKKPLGRRFAETFIGGSDSSSVWGYVLNDVLVPAAKDMVSDAVSQGVERILFGEVRNRSRSRVGASFTNYSQMSTIGPINRRREEQPRRDIARQTRANHSFDDIELGSKAEAQEVLDGMYRLLADYELVAVSDLYELCGISSQFTDEKYGWTDLRGSDVIRVRGGGYILSLPRPTQLD